MTPLRDGWAFVTTPAGAVPDPSGLAGLLWSAATVPGTLAGDRALPLDSTEDLDASDVWYAVTFDAEPGAARVCFDGIATLGEVWLNGERLGETTNMFREWRFDVVLQPSNRLHVAIRALGPFLARKRPRPRWKTALVVDQSLRWARTTLLGRIPHWTPRLPPVGLWRGVYVRRAEEPEVRLLRPSWRHGGWIEVDATAQGERAALRVGDAVVPLTRNGDTWRCSSPVAGVEPWFPHTLGEPRLYDWSLEVDGTPTGVGGRVGFRSITLDRADGAVRLVVNGRPMFARGACWTAADTRTIDDEAKELRLLRRARDGGADTIRVGGTMTPASDAFLRACDALGLVVWQDLMFANMDYPFADPTFAAEVALEVGDLTRRLGRHACVAVYCGGSEIEQQAAMLGLPREEWSGPFFTETLPGLLAEGHPGVPYVPSTPTGGALPFHTAEGLTHYYGVGAYRRPLGDARRADVRFTPECLGFSNVPDEETTALVHAAPVPHLPAWKAGVPRDGGAGWDFEDVRDHYLRELFGVDPVVLRGTDPERYLAVSRLVTAELMRRVFAEWRRPQSRCGGGLVWFYRDLRPGAGWGVVDSEGRPKAAWWALRRAWAILGVSLTDEGLDGVGVHLHNERADAWEGTLKLDLYRHARDRVDGAEVAVRLAPWEARSLSADALIGHFTDLMWAYRFGPPRQDVIHARLLDPHGSIVGTDTLFPLGHTLPTHDVAALRAVVRPTDAGGVALELESSAFLQGVTIRCAGWRPSDDHFHLAPGVTVTVRCTPAGARPFRGRVEALNLASSVPVKA